MTPEELGLKKKTVVAASLSPESAIWHRVLSPDELPEGRVKSATCANLTLCMTHFDGQYAALANECPHQGGPLGEGSIENGLLRCPWHGWDFDPLTGKAPGFDDGVATFPVEVRDDGVYVSLSEERTHVRTVGDLMLETMVNWGIKHVFGMVGHSNLGVADAVRIQVQQGALAYYGIRHEGAAAFACSAYGKLTGRRRRRVCRSPGRVRRICSPDSGTPTSTAHPSSP